MVKVYLLPYESIHLLLSLHAIIEGGLIGIHMGQSLLWDLPLDVEPLVLGRLLSLAVLLKRCSRSTHSGL